MGSLVDLLACPHNASFSDLRILVIEKFLRHDYVYLFKPRDLGASLNCQLQLDKKEMNPWEILTTMD